jgi:hypothetical protein
VTDTDRLILEIADKIAINELTARYNRSWDEGWAADWAATFTSNGALEVVGGDVIEGRDALEAAVRNAPLPLFHVTTNPIITVSADVATQEIQLMFYALADDRSSIALQSSGRYSDELARTPQGWRFRRRRATIHVMPDLAKAAPAGS